MKTCYKCSRQISTGKRIMLDGIKYECSNEEEIQICKNIIKENDKNKFDAEQERLSKLDGINTCNECNLHFINFIVLETMPARYECPFCYKKKYN